MVPARYKLVLTRGHFTGTSAVGIFSLDDARQAKECCFFEASSLDGAPAPSPGSDTTRFDLKRTSGWSGVNIETRCDDNIVMIKPEREIMACTESTFRLKVLCNFITI
jgi:hypothetical protein